MVRPQRESDDVTVFSLFPRIFLHSITSFIFAISFYFFKFFLFLVPLSICIFFPFLQYSLFRISPSFFCIPSVISVICLFVFSCSRFDSFLYLLRNQQLPLYCPFILKNIPDFLHIISYLSSYSFIPCTFLYFLHICSSIFPLIPLIILSLSPPPRTAAIAKACLFHHYDRTVAKYDISAAHRDGGSTCD